MTFAIIQLNEKSEKPGVMINWYFCIITGARSTTMEKLASDANFPYPTQRNDELDPLLFSSRVRERKSPTF